MPSAYLGAQLDVRADSQLVKLFHHGQLIKAVTSRSGTWLGLTQNDQAICDAPQDAATRSTCQVIGGPANQIRPTVESAY